MFDIRTQTDTQFLIKELSEVINWPLNFPSPWIDVFFLPVMFESQVIRQRTYFTVAEVI